MAAEEVVADMTTATVVTVAAEEMQEAQILGISSED